MLCKKLPPKTNVSLGVYTACIQPEGINKVFPVVNFNCVPEEREKFNDTSINIQQCNQIQPIHKTVAFLFPHLHCPGANMSGKKTAFCDADDVQLS